MRARVVVAIAASAVFLLVGVFAAGRLTAPIAASPGNDSAEAGFARDMQVHHQQAVELALIVRDLTDDQDVRLLAYDIATSQSQQAGQMFGWLADWRLPQASPVPEMTWMSRPALDGTSHDDMAGMDATASATHTPGSPMPGYATAEQIAELRALSGVEAEKYFLGLMITHHEGGVVMADALLERSAHPVVTALARSIVTAQSSEIELMTTMLDERS